MVQMLQLISHRKTRPIKAAFNSPLTDTEILSKVTLGSSFKIPSNEQVLLRTRKLG